MVCKTITRCASLKTPEQISKNNATLGNAGYLPTLDLSAGYKGTIDNTESKLRETGEISKENGVFDQALSVGATPELDTVRRFQHHDQL